MFFKYALRELLNNSKFSLIFSINIALGLFGLTLVSFFGQSFNALMADKSVGLLGADIAVRTRYAPNLEKINEIEALLPKFSHKAHLKEFFTMARAEGGESRLVMLSNLENDYPYYGGFRFEEKIGELEKNSAWVYPEVLVQLNLRVGDSISLGEREFKIAGVIIEDSRAGLQMGALAPRIYLSTEGMEETNLLKLGSTVSHGFYYKFDQKINDEEIKQLIKKLRTEVKEQGINYVSPSTASEQMGRSINYLNDFLGLVSLIALFMANVGIFFLYRTFLNGRRKDMAILKCLGLPFSKLSTNYYFHLVILGFLGTLFAILFSVVCLPLVYYIIKTYAGLDLPFVLNYRPLVVIGLISLLSNILIGIPLIEPLRKRKISELFDQLSENEDKGFSGFFEKLYFIPWLVFFYLLSVYVCSSFKVGSIFFASFLGLLFIVYPLGIFILGLLSRTKFPKNYILGLIIRSVTRNKYSTLSFFLALTFSSMLINLTPMLKVNIEDEFQTPKGIETPSLFLFDIQEEQVEGLSEIFKEHDLEMAQLSPMIRARFTKINGKVFETTRNDEFRTREDEMEERSRNRGLNLTYRLKLDPSERIVKGKAFTEGFSEQDLPEASVEARYADRLNIKLGDVLEFDILGLPVEAKVTSLRRVRWTSFTPNFFITLEPGVIDEAPKTFLATAPKTDAEKRKVLERSIVEKFSNISIINVEETIKRVLGLMGQMGTALQAMAILSLVVGLMVLYSLVSHSLLARIHETALLKLLGLKERELRKSLYIEYLSISVCASLLGALFSYLVSYILTVVIFDTYYTVMISVPLMTFVGIQGLIYVLVRFTSSKVVKYRILEVFREYRVAM